MRHEQLEAVVKELRRKPLYGGGGPPVSYDAGDLRKLLPHRPPFLLVDAIDGVDAERRSIRGRRRLAPDDPVFAGHFPDRPVYPGVLQIEAMGQLGICLAGLLAEGAEPGEARPTIMVTRVLHAVFLEPLRPNDLLTITAAVLDNDGLIVATAGQIYKDSSLAALAIQEGCYVA